MPFAHRNGETTPPTQVGYYWFRGRVFRQWWEGMLTVVEDERHGIGVVLGDVAMSFYAYKGKWWGPVEAPWKSE